MTGRSPQLRVTRARNSGDFEAPSSGLRVFRKRMLNAAEVVRGLATARTFAVGELLFAQYHCTGDGRLWSKTDYVVHVLTAEKSWRTRDRP